VVREERGNAAHTDGSDFKMHRYTAICVPYSVVLTHCLTWLKLTIVLKLDGGETTAECSIHAPTVSAAVPQVVMKHINTQIHICANFTSRARALSLSVTYTQKHRNKHIHTHTYPHVYNARTHAHTIQYTLAY